MSKTKEEIPSTKPSEIEALIDRLEKGRLEEGDRDLVVRLLRLTRLRRLKESYTWFSE